jgi:hypothetical protein
MMDYNNMFSRIQQFGQNHPQMQGLGQRIGGMVQQNPMMRQNPMMQRFGGIMGGAGTPQQQPQQMPHQGMFNRFRG